MKIVSPFLKRVVYPSMARSGMLSRAGGGMAVVTYHGIVPEGYEASDRALDGNLVTAEEFVRQLSWLKKRYNVITPEEAWAWLRQQQELPERAVLVTCDDGLVSCVTEMLPGLLHHEVKCLFFVTGMSTRESREMLWYEELLLWLLCAPKGQFEVACKAITIRGELNAREQRRKIWSGLVERLSQLEVEERGEFLDAARAHFQGEEKREFERSEALRRRFGLMIAPELRELAAAGMTIGAHTMSHPVLSQAPLETARREISESRDRLEAVVQQKMWAFAYPFGDSSSITPQVVAAAKESGFDAAFLNYGGGLGTVLPRYELPRVHVSAGMSLAEFDAHVSGLHARLQRFAGRASVKVS